MKYDAIVSNCKSVYEHWLAIANSGTRNGDLEFWDSCEEETSSMIATLNDLPKPPTDQFKEVFRKVHYLNNLAQQHVASCELKQRYGK